MIALKEIRKNTETRLVLILPDNFKGKTIEIIILSQDDFNESKENDSTLMDYNNFIQFRDPFPIQFFSGNIDEITNQINNDTI